jgi:hypothetical protein
VKPVEQGTKPTELPFPMNVRASMKVWNAMFLDNKPLKPEPQRSEQWLRGRYLADGAAHCSTCHTPRGLLTRRRCWRRPASVPLCTVPCARSAAHSHPCAYRQAAHASRGCARQRAALHALARSTRRGA